MLLIRNFFVFLTTCQWKNNILQHTGIGNWGKGWLLCLWRCFADLSGRDCTEVFDDFDTSWGWRR